MASIIPGFEYDIFISYRQKDNKYDGWVTEFVDNLKKELEATFKEEISLYFDINPHDGLLETHNVDASLKEKLKCLIFIPVISQTYCDTNSFAWQHEFCAFNRTAKEDVFGRDIRLTGGNVASRILPVKIHELDAKDQKIFEEETAGVLRAIEFIYREPGVNRPLRPDDDTNENLNKTKYRNQVNKVANAVKEIITAIKNYDNEDGIVKKENNTISEKPVYPKSIKSRIILTSFLLLILIVFGYLFIPKIFKYSDPVEKSIAVIPFSNIKPDSETDFFGFAVADQIIGDLVYLKNIIVRPSGSIRKYEKQAVDPKIVGDDLKVDYILIGNYLKEANIIRINVELVNVNTNELIWRESIEVDYHSAFELQDIVAQKVVKKLNVQFSQEELNRIGKDIPTNPLAYEYYLRSISYPLSNEGEQLAIEMLTKSIELDSSYAPAYAHLGERIHRLSVTALLNPEERKRAEYAFLRALSLNDKLIYALANLAMLYVETARTGEAMELTKQILEINPNNAEAHFSLGYIYRYTGMLDESVLEMEKAVALDPSNSAFRSIMLTYQSAGDYEKVIEAFERFNKSPYTFDLLGEALFYQGNKEQAVELFDKVITMEPDGMPALMSTCLKAFIEGNNEKGLEAARRIEEANLNDSEAWYYLSCKYGLLGDRDGCIRCLQKAIDGGYFNYPLMLRESDLDSMRDDPEFQKILEKAKEKHLAFKKRFF